MARRYRSLLFACALGVASCGDASRDAETHSALLPVPTTAESLGPRLTRGPSDDLILSWMQPAATGATLRFSSYREDGWQAAQTVVFEPSMFVNWADLPSVTALDGAELVAHWLIKRPGGPYAYDIALARSRDGGKSWSDPVTPHTDGTLTQHGFVSLYPHREHTGLIWLDGRKTDESGEDYSVERGMTVHAVAIDAEGTLVDDQEVDGLVCSCCPTDAVMTASGPIAAYRDRSKQEIRDIRIAHFRGGAWQQGAIVARDNWEITACPVNGPKLAATGDAVAVAWFTAPNDQTAVKIALAEDGGKSFGQPITVSAADVRGQVGLTDLGNGDFAVSWLDRGAGNAQALRVRRVTRAGELGEPLTVTDNVMTFSTPQLARHADDLILAWTESVGGTRRVQSARLPASALP